MAEEEYDEDSAVLDAMTSNAKAKEAALATSQPPTAAAAAAAAVAAEVEVASPPRHQVSLQLEGDIGQVRHALGGLEAMVPGSQVKQVEIKSSVLNKKLFWLTVEVDPATAAEGFREGLQGMLDELIAKGFRLINIGAK
jgi:hypothetical protein